METVHTTSEQCGACGSWFDTLSEVFSHDCDAIDLTPVAHPTRGSDSIDPDFGSPNGAGSSRTSAPATDKQVAFMLKLGVPEHLTRTTKAHASEIIDGKLEEQRIANLESGKPANPASDKQIAFIERLLSERATRPQDAIVSKLESLDKAQASKIIDRLLKLPKQDNRSVEIEGGTSTVEVDEGFWVTTDDVIIKVQRAMHGSGNLYAKQLNTDTSKFEYWAGGYRQLQRAVAQGKAIKLTLEKAKELGKLYGMCCVCGVILTNEDSIEAGIGPVCGGRL